MKRVGRKSESDSFAGRDCDYSQRISAIHFENFALSEALCSFGLIFIMFSGGFGTSWKEARYVAKEAILLSSFGVVLTSFLLLKGRREKRGMKVFQGEDLFFF